MADNLGGSLGVPSMHPDQTHHGSTMETMFGMGNGAPQEEEKEIPETEHLHERKLVIRQSPEYARVAMGKEKDRKPIDPPPVVELVDRNKGSDQAGGIFEYHNPYMFLTCTLVMEDESEPSKDADPLASYLCGTTTSSIHHQKDQKDETCGFFVFGDLGVKREGRFRLRFTLFDRDLSSNPPEIYYVTEIISNPFTVSAPKSFPGMAQSTDLTRTLSSQGVKLRLRKDSRAMKTRKRNQRTAETAELNRQSKRAHTHHNLALRGFVSDGSNSLSSPEFTPDLNTMSGISVAQQTTSGSNTSSSTPLEVSPSGTLMTLPENTQFSPQGLSQIPLPIHTVPGTTMGINIETPNPNMALGTISGLICSPVAPAMPGAQLPGAAIMMHDMTQAPMTSSGPYAQEYSVQFAMNNNGANMFEFNAGLGNVALGDPHASVAQPLAATAYTMATDAYSNFVAGITTYDTGRAAGIAPRSLGISDEVQYAEMYLKADPSVELNDGQNNGSSNFEVLQ